MPSHSVLIVGAGPTGLVLALCLQKQGVDFRIVDKNAESGTTSRAIAVQGRTLEFYRQLGIADAVVNAGLRVAGANLWGRGRKAMHLPIGNIGKGLSPFPFVLDFPQDQHEQFLVDRLHAQGVNIERRTELLRFEQDAAGVRATLKHHDGAEEICNVDYVAGCDGARSVVRAGSGAGFPGGTFQGLFYVADVLASGPAIDREVHVDLDDGDFLAIFPYATSGRIRLIGAVRMEPGRERDNLTFDDVRGRAIEHMKLTIEKVNWFSTYHVHHRVADHFRWGRAFLLGDAAHIHSPVGGPGMNTGIGDAINLGWKLADVINGRAGDGLLNTYDSERIRFARRLVATTDRIFTLVTKPGKVAAFVRLNLVPRAVPALLKNGAMRRFAFRTVSQIGVAYRESRLSAGRAGRVHAGDRLPWVEISSGVDNFAPLEAMAWQVHVYGEPAAPLKTTCDELSIALHAFPWTVNFEHAGLQRDAIYLIRPDGYVATATPPDQHDSLRDYFSKLKAMPPRK